MFPTSQQCAANGRDPAAELKSAGKLAELFVLGLIVGAFSLGMSFLWKGYTYRAADFFQKVSADVRAQPLPIPTVLVDIGDLTCRD
jgi:hypothetical protein